MMGSGKTSVGRRVAVRSKMQFIDLDKRVEEVSGLTVSQIFKKEGEESFRELESEVLAKTMAESQNLIVATGGGVVLSPENRALLKERSFLVWLKVGHKELAHRVGFRGDRPLLSGQDPEQFLSRLVVERSSLYAELANLILDGESLNEKKLAAMSWSAYSSSKKLEQRTRLK